MKPKIIEATCNYVDRYAKGHILYDKKDIALNNLLKGEKAKIDLSQNKVIKIIEPSKERTKPLCDKYEQCGSCQIMHMTKDAQKSFKTNILKETFKPLKSMMKCDVKDVEMADNPLYYRNKIQMPVTLSKNKQTLIGFYKEGTIDIIEKDDCFIQAEIGQRVLKVIRQLIKQYKVHPFDWNSKRGTLKYILIRYGFTTNELMVVFVTNGPTFNFRKQFVTTLTKEIPEIKTIVQNINNRKDHLVLDRQENVWYGKGYIVDYIGDVKFFISSKSFYQINPPQVKKLYDCVKEYANLTKNETVIDAYCGVGTIGLYLAKEAKQIFGVELIVSAIDDAKKNAQLNKITNASFQVGDASEYMVKLAKAKKQVDVVVVDPPRSGCTPDLMKSVIQLNPKRFIYVSCNIETQVRDLQMLAKSGYKITKMQGFDLFPETYHIETVCLLSRQDK